MAVPTYPSSIAATNIQTEFGGSNPIAISEYYSGGAYVGSGTANSTGTTIPTTGTIKFLNFSGATAAAPAIGWWYARYLPNTAHYSTDGYTLTHPFRTSANANNMILVRGAVPAYMLRINTSSGTTVWESEQAGITVYPRTLSVANNDSIAFMYLVNTGNYTITKKNPDGSIAWSSNITNSVYHVMCTDAAVWVMGRGPANNGWMAKVSSSDGTTVNFKWGWGGGTGTYNYGARSLMTNQDESLIWMFAGSSGGGCRYNSFWAANGTYRWGGSSSRTIQQLINDGTDRADSSNNIYARSSGLTNEFYKLTGAAASPTYGYTKSVPAGNVIRYITNDIGGNVYLAMSEGTYNTLLTKVDSSGTAQWTRKLRSLRSGDNRTYVYGLTASPTELVVVVGMVGLTYDTKWGSWNETGQVEGYILRLPVDGANTGTIINLSYETMTTQTLGTPGGSWSTNTAANLNYNFPSFVSNTRSFTSNTSKYITGTAR